MGLSNVFKSKVRGLVRRSSESYLPFFLGGGVCVCVALCAPMSDISLFLHQSHLKSLLICILHYRTISKRQSQSKVLTYSAV